MKIRLLVCAIVVIGLLPVAAAHVSDSGTEVEQLQTVQQDDTNYSQLYVERDYSHLVLKPGESDEVTVTVHNVGDESETVNPSLYVTPERQTQLDDSWVSIEPGSTTLDAGEEQEFTISVDVPKDADINRHHAEIAFTDETISYPGRPARPLHSARLNVEVWQEPNVEVVGHTYVHGQIEAGDSATHEIIVENNGDESVPVNPEVKDERNRHPRGNSGALDPSWVEVDAPTELAPGETGVISVTVSPPTSADRGNYRGNIDLGLKDSARDERRTSWQEVRMNVQVWQQPAEAFETTFDVSDRTSDATLELETRSTHYRGFSSSQQHSPSFDVEFVSPSGDVVSAERAQVTDRGSVDMTGDRRSTQTTGDYETRGSTQTFTYNLDDPEAGTWTVRISPENAVGFSYEITRDESNDA